MRASVSTSLVLAWSQSSMTQAIRSNAAGRCASTPAGSARAVNSLRTIRRHGRCPPRRVTSCVRRRSNRAAPEAAGALQVAAVTADDHGQGGDPGGRLERVLRGLQGGGPHALEQVADLLDARDVLTGQLLAAGAEVPQPAPRSHRPVRAGSSAAPRPGGRSAPRPCRRSCPG